MKFSTLVAAYFKVQKKYKPHFVTQREAANAGLSFNPLDSSSANAGVSKRERKQLVQLEQAASK